MYQETQKSPKGRFTEILLYRQTIIILRKMDEGKEQMKTSLVILFKGMFVIKYSKNLWV